MSIPDEYFYSLDSHMIPYLIYDAHIINLANTLQTQHADTASEVGL